MKIINKFGSIYVLKHSRFFMNKTIALSMSGGADSTMLCVLLAKAITSQKLKSVIQPYNGYDIWAPLDSAGLPEIIHYIRKMFPNVEIKWPVSAVFNTKGDGEKDKNYYIGPFIADLQKKGFIDVIMPGISMGPPIDIQKNFVLAKGEKEDKQIQRLPGYRLWNEVKNARSAFAPYKNVDKRFIIQCYKDFELRELLDMTQSCTNPKGNCGVCWWCNERMWAIGEVFNE